MARSTPKVYLGGGISWIRMKGDPGSLGRWVWGQPDRDGWRVENEMLERTVNLSKRLHAGTCRRPPRRHLAENVWAMPPLFKAAGCLAEAHVLAFVSKKTHMHLASTNRVGQVRDLLLARFQSSYANLPPGGVPAWPTFRRPPCYLHPTTVLSVLSMHIQNICRY
jgi:hypothetical protein